MIKFEEKKHTNFSVNTGTIWHFRYIIYTCIKWGDIHFQPYGVNQPGPVVQYKTTDLSGNPQHKIGITVTFQINKLVWWSFGENSLKPANFMLIYI